MAIFKDKDRDKTIWTIDHSIDTIKEITDILANSKFDLAADIMFHPTSKEPVFLNTTSLIKSLLKNGVKYVEITDLDGDVDIDPNSYTTPTPDFIDNTYKDFMETENFKKGIEVLIEYASKNKTALMSSNIVCWKAYSPLISDYLKSIGWKVIHIMGMSKSIY